MRIILRLAAFVLAAALIVYGAISNSDNIWLACVWLSTVPIGYLIFSMVPRQTIGWRRNAWKVSAVLVVGFIVVSLQLLHQQFIVAPALATQPQRTGSGELVLNIRTLNSELRVQRGRIFDRNGVELAGRVISPEGLVRRIYPVPSASGVTGYYTPSVLYGSSGLERAYDDYLSGRIGDPVQRTEDVLLRRPIAGDDVYLTLDAHLQTVAEQLLQGKRGAIVAMNPRTGAVLALASSPTFNAGDLAVDPTKRFNQEASRVGKVWQNLNSEGDARLLNRGIQGLYPPGSTFKTVTASAALDTGAAQPDSQFEDRGYYSVGGFVIQDPNRPDPNRTQWTMAEGYMYSLNAVYAQLGLKLGAADLREYAHRFGYDRDIPFDLPLYQSRLASKPNFLSDPPGLASTAIGQGQLQATPMEVLLTTAAIANKGVLPQPYLVSTIRAPSGSTVYQQQPHALQQVVSADVAAEMTQIMVNTVERGSGYNARILGIAVAGKTGTAQLGGNLAPHAWFTAFAPAENPTIAVTVLVENGGEGYKVAAPLAKQIIQAALEERPAASR